MPELPQQQAKPEVPRTQLPKPAYCGLFLEPAIVNPLPEDEQDDQIG
ncbi:hypothetical protein [Streptomyces sp. NPDC047985]